MREYHEADFVTPLTPSEFGYLTDEEIIPLMKNSSGYSRILEDLIFYLSDAKSSSYYELL
jgi:hypothetical protein